MLRTMLLGRRGTLALAALAALALTTLGCETTECTEMGCVSSFAVTFAHAGAWEAGSYRVTVTVDGGAPVACTVTLPLDCNAPSPCPNGTPFYISTEGCALDPAQHVLGGVDFWGVTPASVAVSVHREGVLLGEGSYSPNYTTSQPNGPDCEPTCKNAPSAELSLL
ncbi:Hypothetical protein CAP_1436 [Chondromyces apiculatus DSM 436]|uniref:Lipoprotein n=2 Tax=Chondromyces apiculatus TaxID=51 RepID=A0A017TBW5_9BACT|nr:Hypothetical protein CAP_1436 [Chondromyces apiculatus DSM 436]